MFFGDIIGQEETQRLLTNGLANGRIAHAQLFSGAYGFGTLPMALAYAQYISCEAPTPTDSCGVCASCKKHLKLSHPDLHFVFPIVNRKKSSGDDGSVCDDFMSEFRQAVIDNPYLSLQDWQEVLGEERKPVIYTREGDEIIRKLNFKAFESPYKIMVIWAVEQMNEACANKILKILEEPQGQTLFILISDNAENIIATIRSRVQQISLPPIDSQSLQEALHQKGLYDSNSDIHIKNAKGNYNNLLKEINHNQTKQQYFSLFVQLMRGSWRLSGNTYASEWRSLIDELTSMGRSSQIAFLQLCQRQLRENFIYNLNIETLTYMNEEERNFADKFAKFVNERNIEQFIKEFSKCFWFGCFVI